MSYIKDYIAANESKMMEDLFSLIRIPSISALPEHHDDMLACAQRCTDNSQRQRFRRSYRVNYCWKPEQTKLSLCLQKEIQWCSDRKL